MKSKVEDKGRIKFGEFIHNTPVDKEITKLELKIHAEVKQFEKITGKTVTNISICGDPDAIVVWAD